MSPCGLSCGSRSSVGEVDRGAIGVVFDPDDPNAFYVTEFFRR
jgi:hypothetical protein